MHFMDFIVNLILSSIIIVGIYQFYFLTQKYQLNSVKTFNSKIDEKIPYWPIWAWIYSFLYYPAILYLNWIATSARHFTFMAFSYVVLLALQMLCFYVYPVATPDHWREFNKKESLSEKFLAVVQSVDDSTNCFPSMHVSVAMLTALHAYAHLGNWVFWFPGLIAISCVFTKQHYLVDLPFGAALGWVAFRVFEVIQ